MKAFCARPAARPMHTSGRPPALQRVAESYLNVSGRSSEETHQSQLAGYRDEVTWLMRTRGESQEARKSKSRLLFHPGIAGRRRSAEPRRHPYRRAQLRLPTIYCPGRLTEVDRALADGVELLGQLRHDRRPQWQGLPVWPVYRDKASGRAMVLGGEKTARSAPNGVMLIYRTSVSSADGPRSEGLGVQIRRESLPPEQVQIHGGAHGVIARWARVDAVSAIERRVDQIGVRRVAHDLVEVDHVVEGCLRANPLVDVVPSSSSRRSIPCSCHSAPRCGGE